MYVGQIQKQMHSNDEINSGMFDVEHLDTDSHIYEHVQKIVLMFVYIRVKANVKAMSLGMNLQCFFDLKLLYQAASSGCRLRCSCVNDLCVI